MAKNLFDFLKPKAQLSRNAFDLSQRHIWSQKVGQIIPVLSIDCVPGDHHEISVLSLTRTMPVKTDAFTRLKLSYSAVFVPYQQLWFRWNEFIAQTQEKFSTLDGSINSSALNYAPSVSWDNLLHEIEYARENYDVDMFGFSTAYNCVRMLDMLGYGSFYHFLKLVDSGNSELVNKFINSYSGKVLNLFRVMAYQKLCNDFYRNNTYTESDPFLFNADDYNSRIAGNITGEIAFNMFSHIWYRQYRKDLFTSLFASPQFGEVSSVDLNNINITSSQFGSTVQSVQVDPSSGTLRNFVNSDPTFYNNKFNVPNAVDVYSIRKAEMLQKWKEDKLRAGNKLKDQSNAMFGRTPRYLMDKYADFIKEIDANVSIDEVVNTNGGSNSTLGEIGGKGIGTANGTIEYDCSDFGVLMIVASIVPVAEYDSHMFDKNNTLIEPFDFFTPHFEDLGFEGVSLYQLNADTYDGSNAIEQGHLDINRIIGYAPRYANYKTSFDKVHNEFMSQFDFDVIGDNYRSGSLAHWCTPRKELDVLQTSDIGNAQEFLYVSPHCVDNVFYMSADDSLDTDHFLFNCNFAVNSVRPMSVLGLPRW